MMRRNQTSDVDAQRDTKHPGIAVLEEIARSEDLPAMISPEQAFSAVMCTLEQALSDEGTQQLQRGLPISIRKLVTRCSAHAEREPAALTDAGAFAGRVAEHLELDEDQARELARTVFHALHRLMSVGEVESLAQELPEELRGLWRAGDGAGDPVESSRSH